LTVGVIAVAGLLALAGVLSHRSKPVAPVARAPVAADLPVLSPEQQHLADEVISVMNANPNAAFVKSRLEEICTHGKESAGLILHKIWSSVSEVSQLQVAQYMMRFTQGVSVPAIASLLVRVEIGKGNAQRAEAARQLMQIVQECEPQSCPMSDVVVSKLGSLLQNTQQEGRGEQKIVVQAAIRTIGWLGHPGTSEDVLNAIRVAPRNVGWLDNEVGTTPEAEQLLAFSRIPTARARFMHDELKRAIAAAKSGGRRSLTGVPDAGRR
jgi:hypothetical protein